MTILATMTLIEAGPTRILAGHAADAESVFVLRKVDAEPFELHQMPVNADQESLRAFLAADQSESGELVAAILQSGSGATRKPRRRKAKGAK